MNSTQPYDWTKPKPKPKSLEDVPDDKIEKIPYVDRRRPKKKEICAYRHLTRIGRLEDDF